MGACGNPTLKDSSIASCFSPAQSGDHFAALLLMYSPDSSVCDKLPDLNGLLGRESHTLWVQQMPLRLRASVIRYRSSETSSCSKCVRLCEQATAKSQLADSA